MPQDDHYQLLGIERSAPVATVQSALQRLADEANCLAYTSPDRSRELWAQIRQIRDDLLVDPARRRAYDASLAESQDIAAVVVKPSNVAPESSPPAPPVPPAPSAAPLSSAHPHEVAPRRFALWPLLAAVGIVALTLGLALAFHRPASPSEHRVRRHVLPVPAGLTSSGFRKGTGFVSERRITLTWRAARGAALYHLQVAAASSAALSFEHPILSTLTKETSHSLKLPGERRYLWRVQALIRGRWSAYSAAASFMVARPGTSAPQLHPLTPAAINGDHVRLCWSPVPWAIAYRLRIQPPPAGAETIVHGTCQTVTEKPGTYTWSVAGVVRGAQTYTGPFSAPGHFAMPPLSPRATP